VEGGAAAGAGAVLGSGLVEFPAAPDSESLGSFTILPKPGMSTRPCRRSNERACGAPLSLPVQGATAPGLGDDESSGRSAAGAANAERDDDDESDTASDARSREELGGSLMANTSSALRGCDVMGR